MRGIIDRFEGETAIIELEDKEMIKVEGFTLPIGAKEGDVVVWMDECIYIDVVETEKRRTLIKKLMDDLFI